MTTTSTTTNTKAEIRQACEHFLAAWNRAEWMQTHGEWASSQWADARETYENARKDVEEALAEVATDGDSASISDVSCLVDAVQALKAAAEALDGQVVPDWDHLAEGLIDPDGVSVDAESLDVGAEAQQWNCVEGWTAYRRGAALYLRWFRSPAWGHRRERNLWVQVDPGFFHDEGE